MRTGSKILFEILFEAVEEKLELRSVSRSTAELVVGICSLNDSDGDNFKDFFIPTTSDHELL